MKIYGNCPKCNHDDRYVSLLPTEDAVVGFTCNKCNYEEIKLLDCDDDDDYELNNL